MVDGDGGVDGMGLTKSTIMDGQLLLELLLPRGSSSPTSRSRAGIDPPPPPTAPAHNRGFFISIGPSGTAADSATVVRPAGLGNGWPPDAGTCCPGASRTQNMPVIAPRSVLGGFRAPVGVRVPGRAAGAANSLLCETSLGQVLRLNVRRLLLALEGHLEEQGAVFDGISVPLPERSPLARDRRAGV